MQWIAETVTKALCLTTALSSADKSSGSALIPPVTTPQQATTFAIIVSHQTLLCLCEAESRQQSTVARFSLIPIWPPKLRKILASRRMPSIISSSWLTPPSATLTDPTWTRTSSLNHFWPVLILTETISLYSEALVDLSSQDIIVTIPEVQVVVFMSSQYMICESTTVP